MASIMIAIGIAGREWFADAAVTTVGLYGLLTAMVLTFSGTLFMFVRARREKVLSCLIRINARVDFEPSGSSDTIRLQHRSNAEVNDPGMAVVHVKNCGGSAIEVADYVSPLTLSFPDREVVGVDVTESRPHRLQELIMRDPDFRVEPDRIMLPRIRLRPGDSFKMVVVLAGTKVGVMYAIAIDGVLRDGRISTEPRRARRAIHIGGAATSLMVGAFTVVLLLNNVSSLARRPEGLSCVPGSLTVAGSSAFGLATTQVAGSYTAFCPESTINVAPTGSIAGLRSLRYAPESERPNRLAMADGLATEFPELRDHPVAIMPFTLVANVSVPVDNLTSRQVRDIFTGKVTRWSQITNRPEDSYQISVVGRSESSGTRRTLERYVLSAGVSAVSQGPSTSDSCRERRQGESDTAPILCERETTSELIDKIAQLDYAIGYADVPDAKRRPGIKMITLNGHGTTLDDIRSGYPFWTVEYVYSYGPLVSDSLASAFVDYLSSEDGGNTMAAFGYATCLPHSDDTADLCNSRR
jgi:phosphate transport system substrate-binding protein